jgi:N-terminal domain of reverse transcriptase
LDATAELEAAPAVEGDGVVNGPEGEFLDWGAVDWRQVEEDVRRLRQRIFAASQAGDPKKVRNLQKLTAPRGALLYPRLSREEFEGRFLGLMPYLELKGEGNRSMAGN